MTSKPALKSLRIKNIGVISELDATFGPGLNILSGETGAGKSMVLSALNLVLGGRAEPDMIRQGSDNAVAEAVFSADFIPSAVSIFTGLGIQPEEGEIILRRTIQNEGKSRAFVNGSPLNVSALKSAGESMVDIHGQHDHQSLFNKDTHLQWLDSYLSLSTERDEVEGLHRNMRRIEAELEAAKKRQNEATSHREYLAFKVDELEKAALKEDEETVLEAEHRLLASSEKIRETGSRIFSEMYEADDSVLSKVENAAKELERLKTTDQFFGQMADAFKEAAEKISSSSMEINSFCSGVEDNPARMAEVETRLATLEKLKRKYKTDLKGLLSALAEARRELDSIESSSADKERLERELADARTTLRDKAGALHKKRMKGAAAFKKEVQKDLKELNMAGAVFEVEVALADDEQGLELDGAKRKITPHGFGEFQFLISANEGHQPRPLAKIASGGEISRIMLALKTSVGKIQPVPVLVFDEIDSGIGGKTADMVGEKLKKLSKNCQIICITHLAQIARQADFHFVVEKKSLNKVATVGVTLLDEKGRVEELARMGAGKVVTDAAREHAKEMMGI